MPADTQRAIERKLTTSDSRLTTDRRELPRLPVVADSTLVLALTEAEQALQNAAADGDLPFSAILPTPAQLVARALHDPPPTELHVQFQRHVGEALSSLAMAAGGVAAAASALSPNNAFNAFQQVGVASSEPSMVTGQALSGARISSYRLTVVRLAAAQENVGEVLAREAPAGLEAGPHTFELRSFLGTKQLTINVREGQTYNALLTDMAVAVNQANVGVLATLARPSPSTVQLAVTANQSGGASSFALTDQDGLVVRTSGAAKVARAAQDAVYLLDGVRTMAPSNQVPLQGSKVQLTLHTISRGIEVEISVGPDTDAVTAAAAHLVDAVDMLASVVKQNQRYLSASFVSDFASAIEALRPAGQQVGISLTEDNGMEFNSSAFRYAFEADAQRVEDVMSSPNGIAQRIGQFAAAIMAGPTSRFGSPEFIPPILPPTSHPTPQMLMASNSLSALLYAQLLAQGLFINSLF